MVRKPKVMHAPKFLLLIVIMKRGRDIASFFAPVNKKGEKQIKVLRELRSRKRERQRSQWRLERGHVMKVRALTQRGKFQRGEEHEEEGEEEENIQGQRDRKWIHVDQVLHHQVMEKVLTICKAVQL